MPRWSACTSCFQNTALRLGAVNLGVFFAAQPDTPVKLGGFAFAFEHLEIAAYELLRRVADRAGDPETAAVDDRTRSTSAAPPSASPPPGTRPST